MSETPNPDNVVKKRAKAAALREVIKDQAELETVASKAANLQLSRAILVNEFELKIAAAKELFKKNLDQINEELEALVERMEAYAQKNRKELFKDKKSVRILGHKIEFRDNGGKVETAKGISVKMVVDSLLSIGDEEFADQFLRYKTTLNKDAVLEHWEKEKPILERIGLMVSHVETFSFTRDSEGLSTSNRETVPTAV